MKRFSDPRTLGILSTTALLLLVLGLFISHHRHGWPFSLHHALLTGSLLSMRETPLDAIPDLSDRQVIVFTDWMGRGPDLVLDQTPTRSSARYQAPQTFSWCAATRCSA